MKDRGGRLDEKDENDRGNDGTKKKYREGGGRMGRKGDRGEVNVKEAFKINKDTMCWQK
jgi:hypothetical protein